MKNVVLSLLLLLLTGLCNGQQKLSAERIKELFAMSEGIEFSEKIQTELKEFSQQRNVDAKILQKNLIYLKTIYNERIETRERMALCDMILNQFDRDMPEKSISFPLEMVKNLKQDLLRIK